MTPQQLNKIKSGIITTLIISAGIFLIYSFATIIYILIISLLIAMIFNPLVTFIEKRGVNRPLSVLTVFILVGGIIFSGLSILMPKVINQFNGLSVSFTETNIQMVIGELENKIKSIFPFLNHLNLTQKFTAIFQDTLLGWINNLSNILYSLVSVAAIMVIVPFLTFFLLKDNKEISNGLINIMPNKYFEVSYSVLRKISNQLSRYVRGWIFDAVIVGSMAGIGMAVLGIENAASIGLIAGVGHLIPYFGPVIGGIPAILIALIQFGNLTMLPSILIMFLLVYTLDNGFIQPHIFSKSTDMHPLVIILLILIGSEAMGLFGMLLAVPAATVIKTAASEIYSGYKNYKIIRI